MDFGLVRKNIERDCDSNAAIASPIVTSEKTNGSDTDGVAMSCTTKLIDQPERSVQPNSEAFLPYQQTVFFDRKCKYAHNPSAPKNLPPILSHIFQLSLDNGILTEDWRNANISPIFEKGDRRTAVNYI
ncbi:hypothetical protein DPMN_115922 [Dreissena polymorpha]|uniref:Uncharacterized protein n=1 Tax=Dreissena polymorpha TaxID=45954 RepID=A0A9D4KNS7_DREPO|nr:hypothetical protein DPMN_115922 [Dreissena polymorpha]